MSSPALVPPSVATQGTTPPAQGTTPPAQGTTSPSRQAEASTVPSVAAPALRIRAARPADLPTTASLHHRCLPRGFFAELGPAFLARYHATFAASPDATLLVAERDGWVQGFLAGTVHNADHYRHVLRHLPVGLVTSGVAALLGDLGLASRFVRTRTGRYARAVARTLRGQVAARAAASGASDPARPVAVPAEGSTDRIAVLTHVAVDERTHGTGAGRALVERFCDQARAAGATEARLVTDARDGAAGFYRRLGWHSRGRRRASDGSHVEEFARAL